MKEINVKELNWDSSMFPKMSDEQIIDVIEIVFAKFLGHIIKLKKKLEYGVFIDDVGRNQLCFYLIKELKRRWLKKGKKGKITHFFNKITK
jgi:hypothetical protein